MAEIEPAFLVAEFATPEAMIAAATALRRTGWQVELHTPFPVPGMGEALAFTDSTVPRAVLLGGLAGAVGGFGLQTYASLAYPLDTGGRPLVAVAAFMMITFELLVLGAVLTGIAAMFVRNRLPRLHHPLFDAERFHLASDDRFFVSIKVDPRRPEAERQARRDLEQHDPASIESVGGELPE